MTLALEPLWKAYAAAQPGVDHKVGICLPADPHVSQQLNDKSMVSTSTAKFVASNAKGCCVYTGRCAPHVADTAGRHTLRLCVVIHR